MQHLTLPEKALVYFLTASGMRIGEALAVEIDMINFNEKPTVITLPARITKGKKKKRITFLTEEATKILKEWLEYRTEYGLRASEKKEGYTFNPLKDKRVFPFQNQTFSSKWQDALEKAGYGQKDEETGRYLLTPHKLRKFFRTRGAWRNADTPEGLMGRISRYNSTYDIMIEKKDKLAQEYLDAELSLSLDDSTQILRESEEERLKYQARIDDVLRNNEIKVAQLENKIFDLTAKVSDQQNLMRDQMEYFKTEMTQMNDKFAQLTKLLLGEDDQPPIDPEGLRARATKTMKEFQQSRRE